MAPGFLPATILTSETRPCAASSVKSCLQNLRVAPQGHLVTNAQLFRLSSRTAHPARRHGAWVVAKAFSAARAAPASPVLAGRSLDAALNIGILGATFVAAAAALASTGSSPWDVYASSVAADPISTKAAISGSVYLLGDLIAQGAEGRGPGEWDRARAVRSGLVGAMAHGPLSHCYYLALDASFARFAPELGSWGTMAFKVAIDQTIWSLLWNGTYCGLLGALRMEPPGQIGARVKDTAFPLLRAGWRLWPLAHVVTYGLVPVQHRLLFVDAVELVWVSILSLHCATERSDSEAAAAKAGGGGTGAKGTASEAKAVA